MQHLVDGSGGLLDGLLAGLPTGAPALVGLAAFHPTVGDAAGDLAGLYGPEGPPHVRRRPDLRVRLGRVPPADLAALIRHLGETDGLSPHDRPGDQGTIEVQTLTDADGTVRHIVYLPGTDDLTTTPFDQDGDVRDLATNLRLIGGHDTTYAAGIVQAMTEAGIGPDDPVLLVGHSQGGMEAAALLSHGSPFHVTHVVTAGRTDRAGPRLPARQPRALAGEPRRRRAPARRARQPRQPAAGDRAVRRPRDVDRGEPRRRATTCAGRPRPTRSTDPSVREQLASLRSHGFLGSGAGATSQVLQITR